MFTLDSKHPTDSPLRIHPAFMVNHPKTKHISLIMREISHSIPPLPPPSLKSKVEVNS